MISIDDFKKVEISAGKVLEATEVEGSEKLIKLSIDLGEDKPRTVLTGMKKWKKSEDFLDKTILIVSNLEPREMFGLQSEGMILAVDGPDEAPVLLTTEGVVLPGSKVR